MELPELVHALLAYDTLAARQWVADSVRCQFAWNSVPRPAGLDVSELAVAAAMAELLAERAGQTPPAWVTKVGAAASPIWLVQAARTMPRLRRLCELDGPEPLRRRGILVPPEFLTFA